MTAPPVKPEFVAEIGRQIAALSAFLGGFAATFLGILLQSSSSRRQVGLAAGAAAVASASFIIALIAGTLVAIVVNPEAPPDLATPEFFPWVRSVIFITFGVGIYANLMSLGLSGWIRSRSLGVVTSSAALVAAI